MFFENLSEILVSEASTIRTAVESINKSGAGACLVVSPLGVLSGIVSDGDIRRSVLAGLSLDTPVVSVMTKNLATVPDSDSRSEIESYARLSGNRHLPVIDGNGAPIALFVDGYKSGSFPKENTVVIMAGGLGMRLRPLTERVPKPLLSVGGKPMIQHLIELLRSEGFVKFLIAVNYLGDQIKRELGSGSHLGVEISYLEESKPLGTCGALTLIDFVPTCPIVVVNGDILLSEQVSGLVEFHIKSQALLTLGVKTLETTIPFGVAHLQEDVVLELEEKPVLQHLVNAGIYVVEPGVIAQIPPGERFDMTELITSMIPTARVKAYPLSSSWMDLGRHEDLTEARRRLGDT